ncbi:proline racemase [Microlunatus sagamiharensis]|uniref:Proline racemase n=1 Tax=Microlunatus sagamiharensis TaxID=546874 RepID=A0A1H2MP75_9ACTN|nr:proline racemase family protein [Microlunatus sagamiharensis]SDU94731.1 proline racemase [Microlunatus sagamiharensis]
MRWSQVLNVVDVHCGGENARVVTGGLGDVPGETMLDKRAYLTEHRDELRLRLLQEPRGNVINSADFVLPTRHPEAQLGYVIAESTEYPVMSGSNTICVTTALLETGMLPMVEPVTHLTLESAAGLIRVECTCADGKVTSVRFTNQPAFVYHLAAPVEVPGLGTVTVDVAWGGMAYVLLDAALLGFGITPDEGRDLCVVGEVIKLAAAEQLDAVHPENPDFPGITNFEWTGPVSRGADGLLTAANAVVVSPGRLDRSPCGTGTSARLAVMHARGEIGAGEDFVHTSIIGSRFDSRIESLTSVGGVPAVVPSVAGQAWITQLCQVGVDPTDPFPAGYALADTWGAAPPSPLAARLVAAAERARP